MKKIIVGVTGTIGAGKDTVAKYFEEVLGFTHHSLSEILHDEADRRGMEQTRDTWFKLGNEIRAEFGTGELARRLVEKVNKEKAEKVILTSIRTPGEVEVIREAWSNFYFLGVDAPIELRYERVQGRGNLADDVTLDKFRAQEGREFATEGSGQQLGNTMAMADIIVQNEGTIEELQTQLSAVFDEVSA